jgi:hypothetical protein
MPRDSRSNGHYTVGNKRPPKHSRFKPGQSGNPAGRPNGSTNLKTKLDKELRKSVSVTKNGKPTKMTKGDVIVAQLVDSSMKGDVRTAAMVLRLTEDVSVPMVVTNETVEIAMPDKDALKRISARLRRLVEDED